MEKTTMKRCLLDVAWPLHSWPTAAVVTCSDLHKIRLSTRVAEGLVLPIPS